MDGEDGGKERGSKCAVFTSIRQARWRCTSEPIRIVLVGGVGGRDSAGPTEAQRTHHRTALDHVLSH